MTSPQSVLADLTLGFADLPGKDRLEALLEFGDHVGELSPDHARMRDAGIGIVTECASPVFFICDISNGQTRIIADAPREAPIARGFVGLLIYLFDGMPLDAVRSAPVDLVEALSLRPVLTARRFRGLAGIYGRLRSAALGDSRQE